MLFSGKLGRGPGDEGSWIGPGDEGSWAGGLGTREAGYVFDKLFEDKLSAVCMDIAQEKQVQEANFLQVW